MIDLEGPWGWLNIQSKDILVYIMEKLRYFESMTWGEIDANRHNHPMPLDKIPKTARERLKERELDDLELYSFHLSGKKRIWGIREREAFYIIWWDPEHTVYRVQKKHT
jgi:hypothetical protein